MNFLLVDRVLNIEPGVKTTALKHITASDQYLRKTPQGDVAIISCIIGEALGQLCSWNVIQASDYRLRLIGGIVREVAMQGEAKLGDTVVLENTIERLDLENQVVNFHGRALVNGETILEVIDGRGPLLEVSEFGDVQQVKREWQNLYKPGPVPEFFEGQAIIPDLNLSNAHLSFDKILQWESGVGLKAQKNVSLIAPYLADHFPHRPVLPLSLLLECKLQLAYPFIQDMLGAGSEAIVQPRSVRKIKIYDFIEPGATVITHMTLKTHEQNGTEQRFILSFRSEVDGKRMCVCEAEFTVTGDA